jgi:hypothetical protein
LKLRKTFPTKVLLKIWDDSYFFQSISIAGHWKLTDLSVQRIKFKPHWTPECDVCLLGVEYAGPVPDPQALQKGKGLQGFSIIYVT